MSSQSHSSLADNASSPFPRAKLIIAATLGNTLEIFDFTVFSFFASIIGKLYFPSNTPYGSLMMAMGVFGAGFIMRPLGSIVMGAYADRAGRKAAMLLTIILMGIGTATIALAPTYQHIGIWGSLLIIIGRLLQGFSTGGEIGASTALLIESAGPHDRGFYVSWQMISQGFSVFFGSFCGTLLTLYLSEDALYSWGWRVPFLVGLAIIPVGLYIRGKIDETFSSRYLDKEDNTHHRPVHTFIRHHLSQFLSGIAILISTTLLTYIILFYMPTYMTQIAHLPPTVSYLMSVFTSLMLIVSSLLSGLILDRLRTHKQLAVGSLLIAIALTYPTFVWLSNPNTIWLAFIFRLILVGALGLSGTANILLIIESLPRPVRATGLAMTYAISIAVFGGTAQFIVTWLLEITQNPMSPAWYLIAMLVISVLAFIPFREQHLE